MAAEVVEAEEEAVEVAVQVQEAVQAQEAAIVQAAEAAIATVYLHLPQKAILTNQSHRNRTPQ